MLTTRKLITMARKWQRLAKSSRKRISSLPATLSRSTSRSSTTSTSSVPDKGHFVVYTTDETRYALPLAFLQSAIFRELLKWAEEEFGLTSDGPITLPCDSIFMQYAISIIQGRVAREMEEALLVALSNIGFAASSLSSSSSSAARCLQQGQLLSCN